jgi:dethiobiotin synthetase
MSTSTSSKYIITGIGTDVGKTVVSAIVAQALNATYWKPVQAGDLDNTDSMKVDQYTTDEVSVLPEQFKLNHPMSPHAAAKLDGVSVRLEDFVLPEVNGNLIVEGAGGLLVPLNSDGLLFADLCQHLNLPIILVSRHYLGSINHTLLTAEVLKNRNLSVKGIIFNGEENSASEAIILQLTGFKNLGRIPQVENIDQAFIREQAQILEANLLAD